MSPIIITSRKRVERSLEGLKKEVENELSSIWARVYDSLVRGEFKETSDLDL